MMINRFIDWVEKPESEVKGFTRFIIAFLFVVGILFASALTGAWIVDTYPSGGKVALIGTAVLLFAVIAIWAALPDRKKG